MRSSTAFALEKLELRRLLSASVVTAQEQYLLEWINRARANPAAEAARQGVPLNEGLAPGQISTTPKQPLVALEPPAKVAQDINWTIDLGGMPDVSSPALVSQLTAAGYNPGSAYSAAATSDYTSLRFASSSFRATMMNDDWAVWGVDLWEFYVASGKQQRWQQVFAGGGGKTHLTGVAYFDNINPDDFYTIGEGLGGVVITATHTGSGQTYTTTTQTAGGYSLELPAGTYNVEAVSAKLGRMTSSNIVIGSGNVKADFRREVAVNGAPAGTILPVQVDPAGGAQTAEVGVVYSTTQGIDLTTLDDDDLLVRAPAGVQGTPLEARFLRTQPGPAAGTITAIYEIIPPGGKWNFSDNGVYVVEAQAGQVKSASGASLPPGEVGRFIVAIDFRQSGTFNAGGDFNGDGRDDLLWRDNPTGDLYIWTTDPNATSLITARTLLRSNVDARWAISGAGDIDGDGDDDILWHNRTNGMTAYWEIESMEMKAHRAIHPVPDLNWRPVDVAHFNDDGKGDILWYNRRSGMSLIWLSKSSGFSIAMLPTTRDTSWMLVGMDEQAGANRQDLVWQHEKTGQSLRWIMAGTQVRGVVALPLNSDARIIGMLDFDDEGVDDILLLSDVALVVAERQAVWSSPNPPRRLA
jgi:hypothetical protein